MKALKQYLKEQNYIPMHMPGHKRNERFSMLDGYEIDVTEIAGCDDLYHPTGILKEAMERAAELYRCRRSFYLVNGSTCGILAALHALCKKNKKLLVARNCHKSVYRAIELLNLSPVYLCPKTDANGIFGCISPQTIKDAVNAHPDAALLLLTCPTYEGVCSDISSICSIAHAYNIPVMTDAAHGAHLGFDSYFPKNPITLGADIAVESLHKTLPSLTQTALLHINGPRIDDTAVLHSLSLFQTSSPSYVLMSSIDSCIGLIAREGPALFSRWSEMLQDFYSTIQLKHLKLYDCPGRDRSKIVILCGQAGISGRQCAALLREKYHIETEMTAPAYVTALSGLGEKKENLSALKAALEELDGACAPGRLCVPPWPEEAFAAPQLPEKRQPLQEGAVSADALWAYPPGIPLLLPNEIISKEALELIRFYRQYDVPLYSSLGVFDGTMLLYEKQISRKHTDTD